MEIEAREAVWHVCVANGVPYLAEWIQFEQSKRLTASFGYANFADRKIVLSSRLLDELPVFQYQFVGHLASHMVVRYNWMRTNMAQEFPRLHGSVWREAMENARIPIGTELCSAPEPERKSKQNFFCLCTRKISVNHRLAKQIQNSKKKNFFCSKCDTPIMFFPKEQEIHVH